MFPGMMKWSRREAFLWFTGTQLASVIRNGIVPEWFHGIISRNMSEDLLMSRPPGYFLIRVSESRIGYTLSYRAEDRCRHFMIDALEDGQYIIVGEDRRHRVLQDLIDFHRRSPIMPFSEVLTVACGQTSNGKNDYADLLFPQKHLSMNITNNSPHPSIHHQTSQEDIPPALPYRPNNLRNSAVVSPNRLYPNFEEEFPRVTSPLPASVMPVTRKRYTLGNPPSNQPPEVPARTSVPPLKQNQACIRTVSAPQSPHTPTAAEPPLSTNTQAVKKQEAKPSVVSNLKNLKKKFRKKRRTSQEFTSYEEINVECGDAENEYQEITGEQTFNAPPFSSTCTNDDRGLPQEYLPPPPFAPGY